MPLIDLSHTIEHGMTTYPGLPGPIICDYLSREASRSQYAPGVEFQIGKIEMVANTGTYLDSPFHRYADGKDLSQLALESLAGLDGVVVRVSPAAGRAISRRSFEDIELEGKAVLVNTGWDVHWRTKRYLSNNPFLTRDAAEYLVSQGAVGPSFLPQRHAALFIEAGSIRLALSTIHVGYLILIISILLIACGQLIRRRERLNRLRP